MSVLMAHQGTDPGVERSGPDGFAHFCEINEVDYKARHSRRGNEDHGCQGRSDRKEGCYLKCSLERT